MLLFVRNVAQVFDELEVKQSIINKKERNKDGSQHLQIF